MKSDSSKTILLIEDERDISLLAQYTLESAGYRVLAASNGREGLELVKNNGVIRLIILDIMMPVMDGYQVLDRLKSDPAVKEIPVLVFSAMAQGKDVEKGFEHGAAGYITKPFEADRMLREVSRFLSPNGEPEK